MQQTAGTASRLVGVRATGAICFRCLGKVSIWRAVLKSETQTLDVDSVWTEPFSKKSFFIARIVRIVTYIYTLFCRLIVSAYCRS